MSHTIKEDGFHNHFSMIPHLIDDLPLRMGAVRLYLRYKRLVGEAAKRPDWVSNELGALVLAKKLGYESKHMIVSYRRELVAFGLIRMSGDGSNTATEILDIWGRNNSATPDPMIANPPDSGAWITPSQRRTTAKQKDKRPSHENVTSHINEQIIVTGHSGENSGINRKNLEEPISDRKESTESAIAPPPTQPYPTVSDIQKQTEPATLEPKPAAVEIAASHPAIVAVRSLMHSYPNKINWPAISAALGDEPDTTKAAACYAEWVSRGYNPKSIKPFTEWYVTGVPEQGRPAAPTTRPQNGRPVARVQADYSTPDKLNAARERSRKAIAERRAQAERLEAQHAPI